jgi:hypothetical protein
MPSFLVLLYNALRGGMSVDLRWRNVVMAPAWAIVLAAAAANDNDKETEEANADDEPVDSW